MFDRDLNTPLDSERVLKKFEYITNSPSLINLTLSQFNTIYLIIHINGDNFYWRKCRNTKKNGFHLKEKFRLKGAASSKKKWLPLNKKVSTTGNNFQEKQKLSLKGMGSTTGNGFH